MNPFEYQPFIDFEDALRFGLERSCVIDFLAQVDDRVRRMPIDEILSIVDETEAVIAKRIAKADGHGYGVGAYGSGLSGGRGLGGHAGYSGAYGYASGFEQQVPTWHRHAAHDGYGYGIAYGDQYHSGQTLWGKRYQ